MRNLLRGLKRVGVLLVISFVLLAFFAPHHSKAAINPQINFQGKLTNTDGTNVTNGTYSIVFSIYTVASGGSNIWTETQSSVSVNDGIFRVALGSVTALPGSVDFNTNSIYLGIKVGADAEMTPRVQFTAAPYAFNSDKLGGLASTGFVQMAQGIQTDSSATNASIAINKTGSTASILQLQRSGSDVMVIANNGGYTYTLSAANNPSYTINNNGSSNITTNLAGSGGFVVQDNGSTFANFDSSGGITFTPTTSSDIIFNQTTGVGTQIKATAVPTVDQLSISNTGFPVTAAGVSGMSVNFTGGAAAVESSGIRVDYTPGGTTGGIWSGMRIIANNTGAASGVESYGIKIDGPGVAGAGTDTGISIGNGFDIGADIASGGLQLGSISGAAAEPAAPASGNLKIYARLQAGRTLVKVKGPSGVDYPLQPALFTNKIGWWTAQGNSTTVAVINLNNTITGTATTRNVATTNQFTAMRRVGYVSAGTAGATAGTRNNALQYWIGNASGLGGFYYVARFGMSGVAANMRSFIGMYGSAAVIGNVNPSTLTNTLGFGCDTGESTFTFQHNSAAGAATKDTLTGTFPCNTANADMYEVRIYCPPNGTTIYYSIENLTNPSFYESSTATDIPANTQLLSPQMWVNNGTTAAAVGIDIVSQYTETDN